MFGQVRIANILITESANLKIDVNAGDFCGYTSFHNACLIGHREIIAMMIEHAELLNLNFKAKNCLGKTALQELERFGKHDIVDLIKRKLPAGTF